MRVLFEQLERAARTDTALVLLGESGTGKDILARGLHEQSVRAAGPFVVFDCGAVEAPRGLLEQADGGTLFLDEVGDLRLALQGHVLRALESRTVTRLGGCHAETL